MQIDVRLFAYMRFMNYKKLLEIEIQQSHEFQLSFRHINQSPLNTSNTTCYKSSNSPL